MGLRDVTKVAYVTVWRGPTRHRVKLLLLLPHSHTTTVTFRVSVLNLQRNHMSMSSCAWFLLSYPTSLGLFFSCPIMPSIVSCMFIISFFFFFLFLFTHFPILFHYVLFFLCRTTFCSPKNMFSPSQQSGGLLKREEIVTKANNSVQFLSTQTSPNFLHKHLPTFTDPLLTNSNFDIERQKNKLNENCFESWTILIKSLFQSVPSESSNRVSESRERRPSNGDRPKFRPVLGPLPEIEAA